jgi:IS5 family transposase
VAVVEPHAPRAKTGRPPFAIETMLRIHYLQQWFGLSDPAMEEALHDVPLYREFTGLGDGASRLPDESTILRFRHLLEAHDLAVDMLRVVNDLLQAKALLLRTGTAVDATLISAPSSTKNASGQRDPAMHQTKKGNQWYFGMKAHMAWMPTRAWCTPSGARRPTSTTWSRQRLAAWAGARCIRRRRLPGRAQAARGQGERDVARGAAPGSAQGAGQGAADGSAHR